MEYAEDLFAIRAPKDISAGIDTSAPIAVRRAKREEAERRVIFERVLELDPIAAVDAKQASARATIENYRAMQVKLTEEAVPPAAPEQSEAVIEA
jgi:hypothetical protein